MKAFLLFAGALIIIPIVFMILLYFGWIAFWWISFIWKCIYAFHLNPVVAPISNNTMNTNDKKKINIRFISATERQ